MHSLSALYRTSRAEKTAASIKSASAPAVMRTSMVRRSGLGFIVYAPFLYKP